ncbi:MAG: HDOD domain-containing protein [Oligoflexia bacterium]|nr:HDOD domain-containing protein [Oligoflexia bacterium]
MIITTNQSASATATGKEGQAALTEARALRYTCEAWFPVNPETLRDIRRRIKENSYLSVNELLHDIRQDFALFGHVLKQLAPAAEEAGKEDFVQRLRQLNLAQLKNLLPAAENKISSHRFTQLNELQCLRLQHFSISSSTVRALVEKEGVDELMAMCAVFFRQLGLALACWNYPRIFQRVAQSSACSTGELDKSLSAVLGFSPAQLGLNIAKSWSAPRALLDLIQASPDLPSTQNSPARSELSPELRLIARLCEHGEAYARSYDPQHFSCADQDRRVTEAAIEESLGQRALSALKAEIGHKVSQIKALLNSAGDSISTAVANNEAAAASLRTLRDNASAQQCPEAIQRVLSEVYALIEPGRPSPAALKRLIEHSISACGFERGCIYLPRASDTKLVPNVIIGPESRDSFVPAFARSRENMTDPVERALLVGTPVRGQVERPGSSRILFVSGVIGSGNKTGVLYLESTYKAFQDELLDISLYFRAVQQALCDALCLGVSFNSRPKAE